jgi:hypothetical protein
MVFYKEGDNMKRHSTSYFAVLVISFLFFGTCFVPLSTPKTDLVDNGFSLSQTITGQILFSPMYSFKTYLIDYAGTVNHIWDSDFFPGEAVYWLGNGTILRTIKTKEITLGGSGGGIQKILWDGTIIWDFRYDTYGDLSHHDIEVLPNGNVLLISWETKTATDAINQGRNPDTIIGDEFMPGHIIEVHQTGLETGEIVWEWHAWDHLIQDYDESKQNYGAIAQHPELININYGGDAVKSDWLHTNSIDYNENFDQILLSVRNFNEIWVIDHSTTTEEAAGHTGGNSGKGGDLLYRWGNPDAYDTGTQADQKLFGQHDASWIEDDYPGAGNILVFNNGETRPGGPYSTIDEITPPVDSTGVYYLEHGTAYGPENLQWNYIGNPPSSFFSNGISGAERLKDGDTLICNGVDGIFFEVTMDGTVVWQYLNPYPGPFMNQVFKINYLPDTEPIQGANLDCTGSLSWTEIHVKDTVNGTFQVQNIGDNDSLLDWEIDTASIPWGTWSFSPENGTDLSPEAGAVTIHVSVIAPDQKNTEFTGYIRVQNTENPDDFDVIQVSLQTPKTALVLPLFKWGIIQDFFDRILKWKDSVENIMFSVLNS